MGTWELLALSAGLAMDAFAVALCKGACMGDSRERGESLAIAASFGFFQALMPLLGYLLGSAFSRYIHAFDHYVAFGLLAFIGARLILESRRSQGEELVCKPLRFLELMALSVATSIDALAAGIAFAMLETDIWRAVGVIGAVTFALSYLAVLAGRRFGARLQAKAQLLGGAALILIGLKVLVEHLSA
ncbi:MAG: manganese efflux pump [Clostridiales bacterium]|mgnify:FL=1|nr:manganese efflux pump [Clostridiales bacterium]